MSTEKNDPKPCYLCDKYVATKIASDVPVCELCDQTYLEPERKKKKEAEKKAKRRVVRPKEKEEPKIDLDWDEGELETQPGWGGFLGIKP